MAMQRVGGGLLERYCRDDRIANLLSAEARVGDEDLTCQRWLVQSPAKRLIYDMLYGDLLAGAQRRVLDVGGGLSALTRRLASRHRYELVDLLAHDPPESAAHLLAPGAGVFHCRDWLECNLDGPYDVVVANDLFPNVDQRLALFLEWALPIAREVRLSLTYYNYPKFYLTRRVDADEVLCLLAWDGKQTAAVLAPFRERIAMPDFAQFDRRDDWAFDNRRQVVVMSMRGNVLDD